MKAKEYHYYMDCAVRAAEMSYAIRKKVGACVVTKSKGTYTGYNGRLAGQDNCCEEKICTPIFKRFNGVEVETGIDCNTVTRKDVVHSEMNALAKMLREGVSAEGSILFVTLSPCASCSIMIASAGVSKVIYKEEYRDTDGLKILMDAGVSIEKYNETKD